MADDALSVALDATALGSGRGGDETYVRGIVGGFVSHATEEDRLRLYVRDAAALPAGVARDPRVRVDILAHAGPARLVTTLPRAAGRRPEETFVGYTHLPVPRPQHHALVVTDLSFVHVPDAYPRAARARLRALVPRQARSTDVLTLSEFCRADLVETLGLDPARVHVVPCALEPPPALDDGARDRMRQWAADLGIDRPFVLYLGNLHPRKNVAALIRAHVRLQIGTQLVVAGGTWWAGGGEEEACRGARPGEVVFTGPVDDVQRQYLLGAARALAYPSRFEGFGLPPLEAMAAGTPVLASNAAAIPEVCGDAALLVDASDPDALEAGLVRIVGDEMLRARLARAGPLRAAEFTVARTGAALHAALRATVAAR